MAFTNNELTISNKSYINKDFQSIYPELVEIVKKLTTRWDPETNESDPLVVLLKLLAFVGDKENYNIDKNILEAFLPSATQEISVSNLTEMNGYTMKYYHSATTNISVQYNSDVLSPTNKIVLKAFDTTFTNEDGTITYTLCKDIELIKSNYAMTGPIIEGTCEFANVNGNELIQLSNLDENNVFYLPQKMIADNGIFIKNGDEDDWYKWTSVNNLNLHKPGSFVFKFGYDSNKELPYIQFPEDMVELIGNGINIRYIITSGVMGNIPADTLVKMPNESSLRFLDANNNEGDEVPVTISDSTVRILILDNPFSAINGRDPETIDEAYNNFKKTIGTFDTLVTVRDFANYLYNLVEDEDTPLVSNIQVGDRRTDINYAVPIVSYNEYGKTTKYRILSGTKGELITPFDLILYPLQYVEFINTSDEYNKTFAKSNQTSLLIAGVEEIQDISRTFINPKDDSEMTNGKYVIKNYYTLDIRITTTYKINEYVKRDIINNVNLRLYDKFNARNVEYGEMIPRDLLIKTIQEADTRIKGVELYNTSVNAKVLPTNSDVEVPLLSNSNTYYYDMVARNVLRGNVEYFNYNKDFDYKFGQNITLSQDNLYSVDSNLTITQSDLANWYTLKENQAVQLFSPNYVESLKAEYGVTYTFTSSNTDTKIDGNGYKLESGDILCLMTTNSDGKKVTYEYGYNYIKITENGTIVSDTQVEANVFKTGGNLIVEVTSEEATIGASQSISLMTPVEVTLDAKTIGTLKAYWFMNNPENRLFDTSDISADTYETILSENEYFFYTDSSYSTLEVFGSGTKLITNINRDWSLDTEGLITPESFTSSNITAFTRINWVSISLTGASYIKAQEQNILTISSGETVKIANQPNGLTRDLTDLNDTLSYSVSGESATHTLEPTIYGNTWQIRTRLSLNVGPNYPQQINSDETYAFTYVIEGDLDYFDSSETYNADDLVIYNDKLYMCMQNNVTGSWNAAEWHELGTIEVDSDNHINYVTFDITSNNGEYFLLNENEEASGNSILYLYSKYNIYGDSEINYPVKLLVFNQSASGISYTKDGEEQPVVWEGNFIKIELEDVSSITINTQSFDGNDPTFMLYWIHPNDSSLSLTLGSDFSMNYNTGDSTLQAGVNTLVKPNNTSGNNVITVGTSTGAKDVVYIQQVKFVDSTNVLNPVFGITGTDVSDFNVVFNSLTHNANDPTDHNEFFYTLDVENPKMIDTDDFRNPLVLFDKNNVYNRYTIPQIDFATSKISISKPSEL